MKNEKIKNDRENFEHNEVNEKINENVNENNEHTTVNVEHIEQTPSITLVSDKGEN